MSVKADATDGSKTPAAHRILRAGLLGRGIQDSRSPRMHEEEGERLGFRYRYELHDFDALGLADTKLADVVRSKQQEGYAGLNITHPFKERVVPIIDSLSPEAAAIGAVNTIVFAQGRSSGHNTDCGGFAESFRRGLESPRIEEVVLIGAGGAGMAVARALLDLGVSRLGIVDVDRTKASRLIESLQGQHGTPYLGDASRLERAISRADGLVNATPVGMAKYPGMPVQRSWLRPDLWVADIIYFPTDTELLKAARAAGCQTLAGAGMAIFQAVKAFELITGVTPDPDQMAQHFKTG